MLIDKLYLPNWFGKTMLKLEHGKNNVKSYAKKAK